MLLQYFFPYYSYAPTRPYLTVFWHEKLLCDKLLTKNVHLQELSFQVIYTFYIILKRKQGKPRSCYDF